MAPELLALGVDTSTLSSPSLLEYIRVVSLHVDAEVGVATACCDVAHVDRL